MLCISGATHYPNIGSMITNESHDRQAQRENVLFNQHFMRDIFSLYTQVCELEPLKSRIIL